MPFVISALAGRWSTPRLGRFDAILDGYGEQKIPCPGGVRIPVYQARMDSLRYCGPLITSFSCFGFRNKDGEYLPRGTSRTSNTVQVKLDLQSIYTDTWALPLKAFTVR